MTITVTQDDINTGRTKNCGWCPVALAVRRLLVPGSSVSVSGTHVNISISKGLLLPIEAQKFIDRFDRGDPVVPFTFELHI